MYNRLRTLDFKDSVFNSPLYREVRDFNIKGIWKGYDNFIKELNKDNMCKKKCECIRVCNGCITKEHKQPEILQFICSGSNNPWDGRGLKEVELVHNGDEYSEDLMLVTDMGGTRYRVLGHYNDGLKKLKPIEFIKYLCFDGDTEYTSTKPNYYDSEVKLISPKDGSQGYDLMVVLDKDGDQLRFLGHFNDGVKEDFPIISTP